MPKKKFGIAKPKDGERHAEPIRESVAVQRRDDAQPDADDHRQDECRERQDQCRRKPVKKQLDGRRVRPERIPKITPDHREQIVQVLDRKRLVEPVAGAVCIDHGLRQIVGNQRCDRVSRKAEHDKNECRGRPCGQNDSDQANGEILERHAVTMQS